MAFDDSQSQTQDDQQKNQGGQDAQQLSGGGGGFAGQASPQGGAAGGSNQPASSGGWTNLNSYLSANADQGQAVGQTLANNVDQSAQNAQGALNQNVSDYNKQYSALPTQEQAHTNIQNTLGNLEQVNSDPSQVSQYQSYLNNSYDYGGGASAPSSFQNVKGANGQSDYSNTQQAYNTASQNLQNTQSESGRDLLLQNQYGSNGQQYNQGEQAFDQLLLQQNPGNQAALNNTYQKYQGSILPGANTNGLSNDIYQASQAADTTAQNWKNTSAAIQNEANTALQGSIGSHAGDVQSQLAKAQAQRDADYQAVAQGLKGNNLTPMQLQQLGLTDGTQTYGVDMGQFLSQEGPALNANQTASASDYANAKALQALASGQTYAQSANLGLGAAPQNSDIPAAYTFNKGAFTQAIGQNQENLKTAQQRAMDELSQWDGGPNALAVDYGGKSKLDYWRDALNSYHPGDDHFNANLMTHNWSGIQKAVSDYDAANAKYSGAIKAARPGADPGAAQ